MIEFELLVLLKYQGGICWIGDESLRSNESAILIRVSL